MRPIGNRVLVRREKHADVSEGGIILPEQSKGKVHKAVVLALGTSERDKDGNLVPFEAQVGDTVLLAKYAAADVTVNGEKCAIVNNADILAVIEEGGNNE